MCRFASLLFAVMIFATPALGEEWPAEARMQMDAAGARLKTATTTAERVSALREIEAIAQAHPDAPDARLTAILIGEKATMEAGPGVMLDALGELATSGQITDTETLAGIAGPLLGVVAEMQENHTLLPSVAIELDAAIQKLDAVNKRAGLPGVAEAISQASGDPKLGAAVTGALGKIATIAKRAMENPDLAALDRKATKEWIDDVVSIGPPIPAFAVNQAGYMMYRDLVAWDNEMFGESTKALNLVADAIETGHFDQDAYNKIHDRLEELKKGPWDSDTAKDILKSLCKSIPIAGAWCDDAFKLAQKLMTPADCSTITCDCEHVGGGLMRGPLMVTCKIQEQDLILQCQSAKVVTGSCDAGASGPGANF